MRACVAQRLQSRHPKGSDPVLNCCVGTTWRAKQLPETRHVPDFVQEGQQRWSGGGFDGLVEVAVFGVGWQFRMMRGGSDGADGDAYGDEVVFDQVAGTSWSFCSSSRFRDW